MTSEWLPQHWSIRTKSAALVAGYVVALLAVFGGLTGSLLRSEATQATGRLRQTAELVAAELDSYVDAGRQRLLTVSRLPGLTYGLRSMEGAAGEGRIPPWTTLHYLFYGSPVFTGGVFLVDRGGKVLWSEPPGRSWIGASLADDGTITTAVGRGEEVISKRRKADLLFDSPYVLVAAPVRNPDGQVDGVLAGIVDLGAPQLIDRLRAVSPSEGRLVDLLDESATIIASSDGKRDRSFSNEQEWMLASVPLARAPWTVRMAQPRAIALAEVWRFQRELLVLGLAILLSAIAIGTPIINGFARDLGKLTESAETMAQGDLSQPVVLGRRRDEIGTLATSLDQMRVELLQSRAALERRVQERDELIQLKEAFLANISHELRTPLNAIIGYNDMLVDRDLDAEAQELTAAVRRQSEHLYHLLSELLTLSGLNLNTIELEVAPVRVQALIARLKPLAERLAHAKPIEVTWDCPPSLPTIETDPLRLEQVLANLINNAFKFTTAGAVTIRVAQSSSQQIVFEVTDTGIGIPAAELSHIFDEFRQVDLSLTNVFGGVGLGLAVVKRMTALLHGQVNVTSRLGGGSTFTVTLPLQFQEDEPQ